MIAISVNGSNIELKNGWNLVGNTYDDLDVSSSFPNASSVWKYSNNWKAVSPNNSLTQTLSDASIVSFTIINAGEGFWVNNTKDENITLTGNNPANKNISIPTSGWHLLSLKNDMEVNIATMFTNNAINTIWKYNDKWSAYSPNSSMQSTLISAGIKALETINSKDGFWINTNDSLDIKFDLIDYFSPPDFPII